MIGGMTESTADAQRAVIARLSADFAAISHQMARVSTDLTELDRLLTQRPVPVPQAVPVPVPQQVRYWPPQYPPTGYLPSQAPHQMFHQMPVHARVAPRPARKPRERSEGWIGKLLAVAGVAVTLIGVALLVVLAAQAGILRPQIRVVAGAALAAGLVAGAIWLNARPGGRVGAIALAATGLAAAYIDVIAVTTVYRWLPTPAGLVLAATVGGVGLLLARRWDSEHLGLLVLVPLLVLAPVVTDGVDLLLVAFMLALAAASVPVQLGRDWIWLHAARVAAFTLPLLVALVATGVGGDRDMWLAGASGIGALLAITSALLLLAHTRHRVAMAVLTAAGLLPVVCSPAAVGRVIAAAMIAAVSAALLAVVLLGDRLPGVAGPVRHIWAAVSAGCAVIAVAVAFDGEIAAPVLLAAAVVLAVAGRASVSARWAAVGFATVGGVYFLGYASPESLTRAGALSTPDAVATLVAAILLGTAAVAIAWSWIRGGDDADLANLLSAGAATVVVYAVTAFTVTAGVLIGGAGGGFFGGQVAATTCWIGGAAALFGYAARRPRDQRALPIGGGLALAAAAMAKLFLFDLGTLDGIFRVAVFIVVGLVLLGTGAGYARLLAQQDRQDQHDSQPV